MLMDSEVSGVKVRVCLCVLVFAISEGPKYSSYQQSEDISAGPQNFIRLF